MISVVEPEPAPLHFFVIAGAGFFSRPELEKTGTGVCHNFDIFIILGACTVECTHSSLILHLIYSTGSAYSYWYRYIFKLWYFLILGVCKFFR